MTEAKRMSKTQIIAELAEKASLEKKQVQGVLDQLMKIVERELGKSGPGEVTIPDLVKLKVRMSPGRPEHEGIDPFTKQPRTFPARPESRKIRAAPVKRLKDLLG